MITYRDSWFELALLDNRGGFPRHTHDEYVISANFNGLERVWLDGDTFAVDPQMITTYNPHQLQGSDNAAVRWQCASLYVQAKAFEHFFAQPFQFTQGVQNVPRLANCLKRLVSARVNELSTEMRQEQIVLLLSALMESETASGTRLPIGRDAGRIKRIKAHLLHDLSSPPVLDTLATQEGISAAHLVRSFHQAVGLPPLAWLMQRRMSEARTQLRKGVSISQVAVSVGFADQAHFTKAFNRFNAMTPGRFQRINF